MSIELKKRLHVYVGKPTAMYGIPGCECGNNECEWSEYIDHLWCGECQKDFISRNWGIFDGPIPVQTTQLMGVIFDRMRISDNKIFKFEDSEEYKSTWP